MVHVYFHVLLITLCLSCLNEISKVRECCYTEYNHGCDVPSTKQFYRLYLGLADSGLERRLWFISEFNNLFGSTNTNGFAEGPDWASVIRKLAPAKTQHFPFIFSQIPCRLTAATIIRLLLFLVSLWTLHLPIMSVYISTLEWFLSTQNAWAEFILKHISYSWCRTKALLWPTRLELFHITLDQIKHILKNK